MDIVRVPARQRQLGPGLESELKGKSAGDKAHVKIAAADADGEYDKSPVQRIPRRGLEGRRQPERRHAVAHASGTRRPRRDGAIERGRDVAAALRANAVYTPWFSVLCAR
jgi:FKBP-type peptidyl-prolyl cis-trans isomerase 2